MTSAHCFEFMVRCGCPLVTASLRLHGRHSFRPKVTPGPGLEVMLQPLREDPPGVGQHLQVHLDVVLVLRLQLAGVALRQLQAFSKLPDFVFGPRKSLSLAKHVHSSLILQLKLRNLFKLWCCP